MRYLLKTDGMIIHNYWVEFMGIKVLAISLRTQT